MQEHVARNVCLSGAKRTFYQLLAAAEGPGWKLEGSKGPDCQSTDVSPKMHMAASASVGKVVALAR